MSNKIKNSGKEPKTIYVIFREEVTLEPGEELAFDGDIEIE